MSTVPAEPLAVLSDEELMRRIEADVLRGFEELYDRYSARAFGLARGLARAWLLTVIRHRSIDVMRRGRRDNGLRGSDIELEFLAAPGSVVEGAEAHDDAQRVRASLRELPVLQRQAVALASPSAFPAPQPHLTGPRMSRIALYPTTRKPRLRLVFSGRRA